MLKAFAGVIAGVALIGSLSACGGGNTVAGCEAQLVSQEGAGSTAVPTACVGLSKAQVGQAFNGALPQVIGAALAKGGLQAGG